MTGDCEIINQLMIENTRLKEKGQMLDRLLYQVARKFPDETRFDTALRYIRQAEEGSNQCQANAVVIPTSTTE